MNLPWMYMCSPSWPPSHLPPRPIPLGHPSAPALSTLYHASNLDWRFISHMIIYMFQCHSPISSHHHPLTESKRHLLYSKVIDEVVVMSVEITVEGDDKETALITVSPEGHRPSAGPGTAQSCPASKGHKIWCWGISLGVQWLRLQAPMQVALGQIPGQGIGSHIRQLRSKNAGDAGCFPRSAWCCVLMCLNLAIGRSWSEPQSTPGLIFPDCIELLHLWLQRI